jgi:hypothetical protein
MSVRTIDATRALGRRTVALFATVAVSASAGWLARGSNAEAPAAVLAAEQRPAPALPAAPQTVADAPLIAVASDGNVTLRVEQQPLQWVLDQIAMQSGWADIQARARPAMTTAGAGPSVASPAPASPAPTSCSEPARPVDAASVLRALASSIEAERFEGLVQARAEGVPVAEHILKAIYETDASERVRVAAFESYLALRADRPDALRAALELALYVPNAAIQRDAQQRLDELRDMERIDALSPQRDP